MAKSFRSLTPEFRERFSSLDLFPVNTRYLDHMAEHHGGISGGTLTDLRAGAAVAEKAVLGLVSMIRWSDLAKPGSREALDAYLRELGTDDPGLLDDEAVVSTICGPTLARPKPAHGHVDYLELGPRAVADLVLLPKRSIQKRSRPCTADDLHSAINWIHLLITAHAAQRSARDAVTLVEAKPFAEKWMGISGAEYERRLLAWIERNPNTVRLALGRKLPPGVVVVAPLEREAYEAIRNGQMASYDCPAEAIVAHSTDILIEAVAERVGEEQAEATNPTLAMLTTLQLQLAHLTRFHELDDDATIRMLSFAGTEGSRRRLAKQGFRPTGATAPRSGVAVMERELRVGSIAGIEAIAAMAWRWMARSVPLD